MSKNKKSADIVENKNVVQAVLVADSFNNNFYPLCNEYPVALLPFVNVPLIDYALECLSLGGVEETFLFCCMHVDKLKEHISKGIEQKAGWSVTMKVNIIISESCRSLGDSLRDLDAKGLLRGDFVLLNADTVSNINFLPILQKHNALTKKDKGAAMTLIFQNAGSPRKHHPQEDVLIVSDINNRILFHQKSAQHSSKKISFPLEIFLENSKVSIHNNLRDTHIAICSSSVLPLFSDNFDFQTRDDFVRGLLMNEEILASTLYWHELSGSEYAARISNWNMYQYVSHDVIHRWVYPVVPDMNRSTQQQTYVFRRNNIYRHRDVKLAKGSELVEDVVIGQGSSVDQLSEIIRSVIGENCKIGKNVKISDSYILPDTVIKDNSVVSHSFIGYNCLLGHKAKVILGSVLGSNVRVKDGSSLEGVIIQSHAPSESKPNDKLGAHCFRVRCISNDDENSDSDDEAITKQLNSFHIESESSDSDCESTISTLSEQMSHMASPAPDDTNLFLTEVIDSLARGFEDKLQCDNLILEINSSRYAYNVTVREVNYNVVKAILNLPFQQSGGQQYLSSLRSLLTYFTPILVNYVRNESAMTDCLQAIEEVADTCSELNECVVKVLHWCYDKDILSEDSIVQWHSKLNTMSRLYIKTQPFIQWLQEADEESESDSE
ncbi:eukaryotic translation initiation factor 2B subunit epsilon [Carabus blaptoides fortunei]